MSFDEIDLKNKIEEQTKNLQIPDSLKPEAVEKKLRESQKKRKKTYYKKIIAAAACGVLVIGIAAAGAVGGIYGKSSGADNSEKESTGSAAYETADAKKPEGIPTAADYDEIHECIQAEYERQKAQSGDSWIDGALKKIMYGEDKSEESVDNDVSSDGVSENMRETGEDYSETNTRESGVGEADIIKTDGKNLYLLNDRRVEIVSIGQDKMEYLSAVEMPENIYISEIFVQDERLVIVYTVSEYVESAECGAFHQRYTVAETFDVSDPKAPQSIGKISQSGSYHTMRVKGRYVYLFSSYRAELGSPRDYEEGYIPLVEGKAVACEDIYMPQSDEAARYMVVSSFTLENPDEIIDNKAIFGAAGLCYVSQENIYICEDSRNSEKAETVTKTHIRKVAYKYGKFSAVGQATVDGTLNDSYSIDEYQGNLRLVTTVSEYPPEGITPLVRTAEIMIDGERKDSNSLYILDEKLRELSGIEGLAEDEQVYSARFMGDTGYFVTYRQMDPLFSMDLSDPKNPKILGELKIPGFSDYLHPYGDGQLLGIGMETDEEGITTSGVKLSMFDISDPENVSEVHKYVLEGTYSTEVSNDYKAAFISVEKNMIGFQAHGGNGSHYYIFSYGENGFTCVFDRELSGYSYGVRAMYAGDKLYLAAGNTVESFRISDFTKVDDIVLGEVKYQIME